MCSMFLVMAQARPCAKKTFAAAKVDSRMAAPAPARPNPDASSPKPTLMHTATPCATRMAVPVRSELQLRRHLPRMPRDRRPALSGSPTAGLDDAKRVVFIGDGAAWVCHLCRRVHAEAFPKKPPSNRKQIAAERLVDLRRAEALRHSRQIEFLQTQLSLRKVGLLFRGFRRAESAGK